MSDAPLGPGVTRLRPDDHFMILAETDTSPMNIASLLILEVPDAAKDRFCHTMRRHLLERLPHTPLLSRLAQSPEGYDSDVWVNQPLPKPDQVAEVVADAPGGDDAGLRRWVAERSVERLDLTERPYKIYLLPSLAGGRAALYIKVHHAITDGVGFQTILQLLSDSTPPFEGEHAPGELPTPELWRAMADARFASTAAAAEAHDANRKEALTRLKALQADPRTARRRTPVLKMSGPTSHERSYATYSVPLARIKALATGLGGTVNDVFLSIAGGALRALLLELDDLPQEPLVANSARSYRKAGHGKFGNRIVALHPHIGTHIADPLDRFRSVRNAMEVERRRTHLDEAMLGQPERPYGARDRRRKFAKPSGNGERLLPGNVSLSNVPGPAEQLSYAGFLQVGNFPVPIIGSGRFLNITSRRNGSMLDMGIMADATRIRNASALPELLEEALAELESAATTKAVE